MKFRNEDFSDEMIHQLSKSFIKKLIKIDEIEGMKIYQRYHEYLYKRNSCEIILKNHQRKIHLEEIQIHPMKYDDEILKFSNENEEILSEKRMVPRRVEKIENSEKRLSKKLDDILYG